MEWTLVGGAKGVGGREGNKMKGVRVKVEG